jgi:hypothetical protein
METSFSGDTRIDIQVIDSLGNNLLNPSVPNSYNKEEVKIYFLINDEKTFIWEPLMRSPNRFFVYNEFNLGDYRIRIFPNDSENEDIPVTLIQWDTNDTDTIVCHFKRSEHDIYCDYLWYNEMYIDAAHSSNRYFSIVKEGKK